MKLSSRSLYGCIVFLKMYFFQYLSFLKIGLNSQNIKPVTLQLFNIKPTLFPPVWLLCRMKMRAVNSSAPWNDLLNGAVFIWTSTLERCLSQTFKRDRSSCGRAHQAWACSLKRNGAAAADSAEQQPSLVLAADPLTRAKHFSRQTASSEEWGGDRWQNRQMGNKEG